MARQSLVIDASIGVKWFSGKDEASLPQALAIRDSHLAGQTLILVPDLFYYEVTNALVYKSFIPDKLVVAANAALFDLGFHTIQLDRTIMERTVKLSRQLKITVYDACYIAIAQNNNCPLVTANPRHQVQVPGCQVIPIKEWR